MTAREQELEQRAEAAERRAAQLERRITELRREALLPCQVCQDAGSDASRRVSAEQWELLVDTLLLVEPIWERSKETRVECIRPNRENLDLDPVALVKKSSALIAELQDNLERCERLREAANEADSSLFSLFPFSAGTFKRAATFDLERMQATPARLSSADATTSAWQRHQQQPQQQQPSQQRLEESVSKRHDQDHNQEVLMDDFLNESELEADAAEVEL
ncbi:Hypothetical Protein FCC1311_055182 [Hondaea fermentalgiana]|uniref:Uncharacterized protein n=1 Tax=Hondaea fermentalgiana TaxID=2315210 RepID=A0A2R5GEE8_9STRA|nr:Hypothetical Protein FCC1311_055182 [Hondaea fermentalgiana]|eukprot:GBG29296.1 Hypothetical Protein FCC1311_055182 [Hondaea fermentalgiana]